MLLVAHYDLTCRHQVQAKFQRTEEVTSFRTAAATVLRTGRGAHDSRCTVRVIAGQVQENMILRTARRLPRTPGHSWPLAAAHHPVPPTSPSTSATRCWTQTASLQRRTYAISKLQTKLPDEIIERLEAVKWVEGEQDPDHKIQSESSVARPSDVT